MLNLKVDSKKSSPKYESCKKLMGDIKSTVSDIEQLEIDPEDFIYAYFEEIKRKVDLRREVLKLEIDDYSDKIIHDIEKIKAECYELSKIINNITVDIQTYKDELNDLCHDFGSFDINDDECENISTKIEILRPNFEDSLVKYKYFLLKDEDYFFDLKEISIEDIFGRLTIGKFINSKIFDQKDQIGLIDLCEFPKNQKWNLAYRASSDGFGAKYFHAKCDGIKNTLTVIKTTNGNIFGGYTDKSWGSEYEVEPDAEFKSDPNAFIFSLKNEDGFSFKAKCRYPRFSICNAREFGPIFGCNDIDIYTDSNINQKSYAWFGDSYTHPNYLYPSYILTGRSYFQTTEIEVYYKDI